MNSPMDKLVAVMHTFEPSLAGNDLPSPTPEQWFAAKYPAVAERFGSAAELDVGPGGVRYVSTLSEDFLAASLGESGDVDRPTVFLKSEGRFLGYNPTEGIYVPISEQELHAQLSSLLRDCAEACRAGFDVATLEFRLAKTAMLKGVVERAKGLLGVGPDYFQSDHGELIACQNGMLKPQDMSLVPFGPQYRRRNKLGVAYNPEASCPTFLGTLMEPAMSAGDLDLIQRWCGLALIGVNVSQVMLVLTGTAGGGKGTFMRVLKGIIGKGNVGSLRTNHLTSRFEIGRLMGSTLLYGADVKPDFLNCEGASVLKSLTGGDPMVGELKGSNERPEITAQFNVVVTSNSRLTVRLEGDAAAWQRRLRIINYQNPPTGHVISNLSERILQDEGSGVLNWMLEGLKRLRQNDWRLDVTSEQQRRVDDLLLGSEAHEVFAREMLVRDQHSSLGVQDAHEQYSRYCESRGWLALPLNQFSEQIQPIIERQFGISPRHDIPKKTGGSQRGWKGIRCSQE